MDDIVNSAHAIGRGSGPAAQDAPPRSDRRPAHVALVADAEVAAIRDVALAAGARDAVVTTHFSDGGRGAEELARATWAAATSGEANFRYLYPDDLPLREKIEAIALSMLR